MRDSVRCSKNKKRNSGKPPAFRRSGNTAAKSGTEIIMTSKEIMELDGRYALNTYARFPVALVSGKGAELYDAEGKRYIDMGTGIGVSVFGACDEEWRNSVTEQLSRLQHTSNLYYNEPSARLAELICTRTGMSRVFFCNSGAEANECAIKAARKYGEVRRGKDCYTVITLQNSFHGRTITTLSATGQDVFHKSFTPMTEGFVFAEANCLSSVEKLINEHSCAAIMLETVQGEGGVIALEPEFIKGCEKLCREHDLLFIVDEVQTGNGRTGELYAYMNYGVSPDVFTTAKGIAGGLPMGATVMNEKAAALFTAGSNGSTFGANPVCAAGALSVLSRLDGKLLDGVRERGEFIRRQLDGVKGVVSVSGLGLMLGIELECDAGAVINRLIDKGVLVLKAKNKIRLLPPLNIPTELLGEAVGKLAEAITEEMNKE